MSLDGRCGASGGRRSRSPWGAAAEANGAAPLEAAAAAPHPLLREEALGMNATSILAGYYGTKGERVRHVVQEGALRLPAAALEMIAAGAPGADDVAAIYDLPGLDSVVRPSRDAGMGTITVTELYGAVLPPDPANGLPERFQCHSRNRLWRIDSKPTPSESPERIRGGGGDGDGGGGADPKPAAMESGAEPAPPSSQAASIVPSDAPPAPSAAAVAAEPLSSAAPAPDAPAVGETNMAAPVSTVTPASAPSAPVEVTSSSTPAAGTAPAPAAAPSAVVTSGASSSGTPAAPPQPQPEVVPLANTTEPQWEQHALALPASGGALGTPVPMDAGPDWYTPGAASEWERTLLPEWFDGSAVHRTEQSYVASRDRMVDMSRRLGDRYLTATLARRSIPGDVGSLLRLHAFLSAYGLVNGGGALNESAPTPVVLQESKAKYRWSEPLQQELLRAVVEQARKRRRLPGTAVGATTPFEPMVDWAAVARAVGHGVTAADCERQFLALPIEEPAPRAAAPAPDSAAATATNPAAAADSGQSEGPDDDAKSRLRMQQEILQEISDRSDDTVIHAVTEAAFRAGTNDSDDLAGVRSAAVVGLVAHQAFEEARSKERIISRLMNEIVDMRMTKLENRLALLDDVEGLLENERVALELERRDLYTARCRHWFGGA